MPDKFSLSIITPERVVFQGEVEAVYAPGYKGEFGVLAGHKPYLVILKIGELKIRQGDKWLYSAISGGFAEVDYRSMKILAETCEICTEIDIARAEKAKARAEENLKKLDPIKDEQRFLEAQLALYRALNRLQVAKKQG